MKKYGLFCLFMTVSGYIFSDPLAFDTSFNQPDGYAYVNPGIATSNSYAYSEAIALDQNNNIILAGKANNYNQNNLYRSGIALVRYLPDGSLDESFNASDTPGYVLTFLNDNDAFAKSVAVQNDGSIVVAGGLHNSYSKLMVARYLSDGQLDATFNSTGFYTNSSLGTAFGVAIQSDNKIVVIGGEYSTIYVFRLNSDGTPDNSFGISGKVIISSPVVNYSSGFGRDIVLLEDGSIIGIGYFGQGYIGKFIITFKLSSEGLLDSSFGDAGITTLGLGSGVNCDQIKIDALGKFVIGGTVTNASTGKNEALVVRYTQNGLLDYTFGNEAGYVITQISTASLAGYGAIAFDTTAENFPGYGIFYINYHDNTRAVIVKYNYNGSLNSNFTDTGYQTINLGNGLVTTDAVMQLDQKLVIAGRLYKNSRDNCLAMRFLNNIRPHYNVSFFSNTLAEANYGYHGYPTTISDFLTALIAAYSLLGKEVSDEILYAIEEIIKDYQASYASQPDFNYLTNLYLIKPYILEAQLLFLEKYPDSSLEINTVFALLFERIKKLA